MNNLKHAIRFHELSNADYNKPFSLFSKESVIKTTDTFIKTFDALGSLTELIIQKNKTNELSMQLNAKKRILDARFFSLEEQKMIEIEEYTKRLQIQLQFEKKRLEIDTKKLILEASNITNDFAITFEENMRSNQILHNLISKEANFLDSINDYIINLADDYSQRKEYVYYCEMQRRSLVLVDKYIEQMI